MACTGGFGNHHGAAKQAPLQEVIELNVPVARSIARQFRGRGENLEDLEQVAYLGLIKAARGFDPARGRDFPSYAVSTINGELKRGLPQPEAPR